MIKMDEFHMSRFFYQFVNTFITILYYVLNAVNFW